MRDVRYLHLEKLWQTYPEFNVCKADIDSVSDHKMWSMLQLLQNK